MSKMEIAWEFLVKQEATGFSANSANFLGVLCGKSLQMKIS